MPNNAVNLVTVADRHGYPLAPRQPLRLAEMSERKFIRRRQAAINWLNRRHPFSSPIIGA